MCTSDIKLFITYWKYVILAGNIKNSKNDILLFSFSDDVAHIGIAMGTPGDKTNIGKVVKAELQQQTEQEQQGFTLPLTNIPFRQPQPGMIVCRYLFLFSNRPD